jgi:hypothetical protein
MLPLLLPAQQGHYPRTMYVSFDRTPVYAGADYRSEIIDTLRLHDSVAVIASQTKYFQVSMGGKTGYILWSNLSESIPRVAREKGVKAQTARKGGTGGPAASGNDAPAAPVVAPEQTQSRSKSDLPQCKAITKAGKQCSRRASDTSGYCWQHKPGR